MYACSPNAAAAPDGESSFARPGQWPLPLKVLAFVVAFAAFKPLGVAALIYFIVQARKRRPFARRAFVGNSAFAEHRRQTLDTLADEERAFAEFLRQQREARDREAFEHFRSDRPRSDGKSA